MHTKHPKLSKPDYGFFHRNEWGIIGTTCDQIQELARLLIARLSGEFRLGYIDADHAHGDGEMPADPYIGAGATQHYTDKITYHEFAQKGHLDTYQFREKMMSEDAVLVNGNHFMANRQILVIDPKKATSIRKKLNRLTQVDLILLVDGVTEVPADLKAHLADQAVANIPVYSFENVNATALFLQTFLRNSTPPIYGLVLAGGKSRRMGEDKGRIDYHGMPQREYAFQLLHALCEKTFLSCRPDQSADPDLFGMPMVFDSFLGLGPFGALLSAFKENPNVAWLVVACDLPLLDKTTLQFLINHRQPSKYATAFNSPSNEFPEPLITIWEPRSYSSLLSFLGQGYSCPRKVLINTDIARIDAPDAKALTNVNTPEERKRMG